MEFRLNPAEILGVSSIIIMIGRIGNLFLNPTFRTTHSVEADSKNIVFKFPPLLSYYIVGHEHDYAPHAAQ